MSCVIVRQTERRFCIQCRRKCSVCLWLTVRCMQVGWPKRKLAKLETALKGSYLVSAVLRRELRADATIVSEQLIGLIRCTSDRVFNATIWDVLVSPDFQVGYPCLFAVTAFFSSTFNRDIIHWAHVVLQLQEPCLMPSCALL